MRILAATAFTLLLSAPSWAQDLGQYRPGTPYHSVVAPGADVCDNQCSGDALCRGWNYVKANPRAPGVCEFLSSAGAPIASAISISGTGGNAAPLSSRVTQGGTNTVRVGTMPPRRDNTVRVGQAPAATPSTRRVIQQPVAPRIRPRTASAPIDQRQNLSLTEQQNLYRQAVPQPVYPQAQRPAPQQARRPMFRPALDSSPQVRRPQFSQQPARLQMAPQPPQATQQRPRPAAPYRAPSMTAQRPQARPLPPLQAPVNMPRRSLAPSASQAMPQPAAPTGLYGSLNDDTAPIAASPSVPVTKEALPPLAGGR